MDPHFIRFWFWLESVQHHYVGAMHWEFIWNTVAITFTLDLVEWVHTTSWGDNPHVFSIRHATLTCPGFARLEHRTTNLCDSLNHSTPVIHCDVCTFRATVSGIEEDFLEKNQAVPIILKTSCARVNELLTIVKWYVFFSKCESCYKWLQSKWFSFQVKTSKQFKTSVHKLLESRQQIALLTWQLCLVIFWDMYATDIVKTRNFGLKMDW